MAFPFFPTKNVKDEKKTHEKLSPQEGVLELNKEPLGNEKKETGKEVAEIAVADGSQQHKKFSIHEHTLLIRPLVTEKALVEGQRGAYLFEVSPYATKISVKKAIFNVYGVMPSTVNIVRRKGKSVRFGKIQGKRKDQKRAYITLPKGQKIEL